MLLFGGFCNTLWPALSDNWSFLACVCFAFVHVCLYVPCGHLLGKGWPLGSRLWHITVSLSHPICILGHVWYLIVSIPDSCTLAYFEKHFWYFRGWPFYTGSTVCRLRFWPIFGPLAFQDTSAYAIILGIHHECESFKEKSVLRITVWHHEACRVMTNGDSEGRICLSYPQINNTLVALLFQYELPEVWDVI